MPPARALALRKAAALLLLAAAVALPCAVLYRAAVDARKPVYVARARRLWWEGDPPPTPVAAPEDSEVDPLRPGDLVGFASSSAVSVQMTALHLTTF